MLRSVGQALILEEGCNKMSPLQGQKTRWISPRTQTKIIRTHWIQKQQEDWERILLLLWRLPTKGNKKQWTCLQVHCVRRCGPMLVLFLLWQAHQALFHCEVWRWEEMAWLWGQKTKKKNGWGTRPYQDETTHPSKTISISSCFPSMLLQQKYKMEHRLVQEVRHQNLITLMLCLLRQEESLSQKNELRAFHPSSMP